MDLKRLITIDAEIERKQNLLKYAAINHYQKSGTSSYGVENVPKAPFSELLKNISELSFPK